MYKTYLPLNSFDINGIRQNPSLLNNFKVSAKYVYYGYYAINVLNSETGDKCWHSGEQSENNYITIELNNKWIYLTNYSIQAPDIPSCTSSEHFPKDWDLYGYKDSTNEEVLLSEIRGSGFKEKLQIIVFNIDENKQGV